MGPTRDFFEKEFEKALAEIEPSSTVGHCVLRRFGPTVKTALRGASDGVIHSYDPDRVAIFREAVWMRLCSPEDADPIRCFIKREPHKRKKIEEGRYRLISAVSLVDTMTDRLMFGWLARAVLEGVGDTPCMVGWSPVGGGARVLSMYFAGLKTRSLDMSGWDWTVPGWMLRALKEVLKILAVAHNPGWSEWVDKRWQALFRDAIFVFGNGMMVQQPGWGLMKSGCFLTIILNSLAQILLHEMAVISLSLEHLNYVVLGDDKTIQAFRRFAEYQEFIRGLGFKLKDSEEREVVEFAGFVCTERTSVPEYREKHVYAVLHGEEETMDERLSMYSLLYVHEPVMYGWVSGVLAERNPTLVRPRAELLGIFDGIYRH